MKTNIDPSINHSLIIEEDDLRDLFHEIISYCQDEKDLTITAECINGKSYETNNIEDIISLSNPNSEKIKSISICANNEFRFKYESLPYIKLNISTDYYQPPAKLIIKSNDHKQAESIKDRLEKKLKHIKPSLFYDYFARTSVWIMVWVLSLMINIVLTFSRTFGLLKDSQPLNLFITVHTFNIISLSIVFFIIFLYGLELLKQKLFPKVFFLLGKQKKEMKKIEAIRNFIISVIIFGLIIGVLASIIATKLMQ